MPRAHRRDQLGLERRRGGKIGTGSGEEGERPEVSNLNVIGKGRGDGWLGLIGHARVVHGQLAGRGGRRGRIGYGVLLVGVPQGILKGRRESLDYLEVCP